MESGSNVKYLGELLIAIKMKYKHLKMAYKRFYDLNLFL
jgi:hypothetical protein